MKLGAWGWGSGHVDGVLDLFASSQQTGLHHKALIGVAGATEFVSTGGKGQNLVAGVDIYIVVQLASQPGLFDDVVKGGSVGVFQMVLSRFGVEDRIHPALHVILGVEK